MLTHPKILVWGAFNFEKLPKTRFPNVADMYSRPVKIKLMVTETSNMVKNDL